MYFCLLLKMPSNLLRLALGSAVLFAKRFRTPLEYPPWPVCALSWKFRIDWLDFNPFVYWGLYISHENRNLDTSSVLLVNRRGRGSDNLQELALIPASSLPSLSIWLESQETQMFSMTNFEWQKLCTSTFYGPEIIFKFREIKHVMIKFNSLSIWPWGLMNSWMKDSWRYTWGEFIELKHLNSPSHEESWNCQCII